MLTFVQHELRRLSPAFNERIQFLCKPFIEAYYKAIKMIQEAFGREPIECSGTLILPSYDKIHHTVFYRLSCRPYGNDKLRVLGTVIGFSNENGCKRPMLEYAIRLGEDGEVIATRNHLAKTERTLEGTVINLLTLLLFIKYCEVETKVVGPGRKAVHVNETYLNETTLPIEVLDSTWFTTLIRGESFMVGAETGGFFKLQPCGEGLRDRKLIWVLPYEKKGYVRKARVLKEQERAGDD